MTWPKLTCIKLSLRQFQWSTVRLTIQSAVTTTKCFTFFSLPALPKTLGDFMAWRL